MGKAIGASLPLAVGIALSPVPIIAVVLMLTSRLAKVNGPAFVLGWLIGLGIVGAIVLAVAGAGSASKSGSRPRGSAGSRSPWASRCCWSPSGSSAAVRAGMPSRRCPSGWRPSTRPPRSPPSAMSAHNAVIMAVLCLVITAKLIGDGISGLT
jgi:Sap, sulfolipid-1-addressing protein